jgi:hypothetical protein
VEANAQSETRRRRSRVISMLNIRMSQTPIEGSETRERRHGKTHAGASRPLYSRPLLRRRVRLGERRRRRRRREG